MRWAFPYPDWHYYGVGLRDRPDYANVARLDRLIVPMIIRMKQHGIGVDRGFFRRFRTLLIGKEKRIAAEIRNTEGVPDDYNPASRDQVASLLFDKLSLDPRGVRRTKTGKRYRVDAESLLMIADQHPIVPLQIEFSQVNKLRTTYTDKITALADRQDRIHGDFRLTVVPSGRIATRRPNLMAQPVRGSLGRQIRRGFVARRGCKFVSLDQSQIELRIGAHCSADTEMLKVYRRNGDIHQETATSCSVDRFGAKRVNFGIFYGITADGVHVQIVAYGGDPEIYTVERCAEIQREWFRKYRGVLEDYIRPQKERARRNRFVWDMWGRVIPTPSVLSPLKHLREYGFRLSINTPIQAGAQGTMKISMARINREVIVPMRQQKAYVEPVLQIHDDLMSEVEDAAVDEYSARAKEVMETAVPLRVPIKASVAVGERWSDLKE